MRVAGTGSGVGSGAPSNFGAGIMTVASDATGTRQPAAPKGSSFTQSLSTHSKTARIAASLMSPVSWMLQASRHSSGSSSASGGTHLASTRDFDGAEPRELAQDAQRIVAIAQ